MCGPCKDTHVPLQVIEFCEKHRGDRAYASSSDAADGGVGMRTAVVSDWDRQFFDVDQDVLFEIIVAANYLDIKSLV